MAENTPTTQISSGSAEKISSDILPPNHPFYLNPSDSPGMNLLNVSFDGSSYGNWKRGMLFSLSAKNKLCFINKKSEIPNENSPLFDQWRRCNDMVIAWLLNSLSKDIFESLLYSQTASDLWNELEERYGQPDGSKLFQIQRDLNNITQGASDIASYFNKLKKLWDQQRVLNTFMGCTCDCKCGAKEHNEKMNEDIKLMQFLMGLNEAYSTIRANILMMKPLPNTSQAYSIMLNQESQREVNFGNMATPESSAFNVSKWNDPRNFKKENSQSSYQQSSYPKNFQNNSPGNNLFCTYCKKTNHTRQGCYRLIGYPPDFKFTNKQKKPFNNARANAVAAEDISSGHVPSPQDRNVITSDAHRARVNGNNKPFGFDIQSFSKDQCEQLIHMFRSVQHGTSTEEQHNANMAGPYNAEEKDFW